MKKEPKVIIAMINFNSDDMTLNCLKDLQRINYKNKEIIVLDNGSKKESVKKLEEIRKEYNFDLVKQKTNTGFAKGSNILIEKCLEKKPKYIFLINNDVLFPDKNILSKMLNKFKGEKGIKIICPIILTKDNLIQNGGSYAEDYLKYKKRIYENAGVEETPKKDYFIDTYCACAWLIDAELLKKENFRFKEKYFAYCEDDEFCIRMKEKSYKILVDRSSRIIHLGGISAERAGSGFALHLITRNEFWLRREHASPNQKRIYYLNYFLKTFPKTIAYIILIKRNFKLLKNYFIGIKEGLFEPY